MLGMTGLLDGWVRSPEQNAAFDAYLAYMDEKYGPVPDAIVKQVEAEFELAFAEAAQVIN